MNKKRYTSYRMEVGCVVRLIPNITSGIRILLSLILLYFHSGLGFWIIYFICGISDMFDGFLARKFQVTSKQGEVLDSVADMTLVAIVAIIILPSIILPMWIWSIIILIGWIKICTMVIGYYKFHTFASIHTYGNKLTGISLFFYLPFLLVQPSFFLYILLAIALLSAMEELLLQFLLKEGSRDRKSIFLLD